MALFFDFPAPCPLGKALTTLLQIEKGAFVLDAFPDGESYIQLKQNVKDRNVLVQGTFMPPNRVLSPFLFFASALKAQGAKSVGLLAPYLPYMRQDKIFQEGEALTSLAFAKLISSHVDYLVTVDPHLHRYHTLSEIYSLPTTVAHAAPLLAEWIHQHVPNPFLIGPDRESFQWVQAVAGSFPFLVLNKVRDERGNVTLTWPETLNLQGRIPILIDDIIASGGTMIQTVQHLKILGTAPPICLVIHPIFAGHSYQNLKELGVSAIVSCNSLPHPSNQIDLSPLLAPILKEYLLSVSKR